MDAAGSQGAVPVSGRARLGDLTTRDLVSRLTLLMVRWLLCVLGLEAT